MENRWTKAKNAIKRHAPIIATTAVVTSIGWLAYNRKVHGQWHVYVLSPENVKAMVENAKTTVVFKEMKTMITAENQ